MWCNEKLHSVFGTDFYMCHQRLRAYCRDNHAPSTAGRSSGWNQILKQHKPTHQFWLMRVSHEPPFLNHQPRHYRPVPVSGVAAWKCTFEFGAASASFRVWPRDSPPACGWFISPSLHRTEINAYCARYSNTLQGSGCISDVFAFLWNYCNLFRLRRTPDWDYVTPQQAVVTEVLRTFRSNAQVRNAWG
jgi:hypothetical protein